MLFWKGLDILDELSRSIHQDGPDSLGFHMLGVATTTLETDSVPRSENARRHNGYARAPASLQTG